MAGYLLDANHVGQTVTRSTQVRKRLEAARKAGERLGTCVPVLCEIEAGIQQVSRPEEYRTHLKRLFRFVKIWPLEMETALLYGEVYQELRGKGRTLSQVDMIVAARTTRRPPWVETLAVRRAGYPLTSAWRSSRKSSSLCSSLSSA